VAALGIFEEIRDLRAFQARRQLEQLLRMGYRDVSRDA
jgi:hypothetical protein